MKIKAACAKAGVFAVFFGIGVCLGPAEQASAAKECPQSEEDISQTIGAESGESDPVIIGYSHLVEVASKTGAAAADAAGSAQAKQAGKEAVSAENCTRTGKCKDNEDTQAARRASSSAPKSYNYAVSEENAAKCKDEEGNVDHDCMDDQQVKAIHEVVDNFPCVSTLHSTFLGINFTASIDGRVYQDGDTYLMWENPETPEKPVAIKPAYTAQSISTQGLASKAEYYDICTGYEPGTRVFEFYLIDPYDSDSKWYGKWTKIAEKVEDPEYQTVLDSLGNMDYAGPYYASTIMRRNDKYERWFGVETAWPNVAWEDPDGKIVAEGTSDGSPLYRQSKRLTDQILVVKEPNRTDYRRLSAAIDHSSAEAWVGPDGGGTFNYLIPGAVETTWKELEDLDNQVKEMGTGVSEYTQSVTSGKITIDRDTGKWVWENHYSGYTLSQQYAPPITGRNPWSNPGTHPSICFGQYRCACEDINVLCSCEDEEAGCSPATACPDGKSCKGPVSDDIGGSSVLPGDYDVNHASTSDNKWGGTIPKKNPDGYNVPSNGPGGITGTGCEDYKKKYTNTSATLTN